MQPIAWEALYNADFTLNVPFHLKLTDSHQLLVCEKIIRFVPKKRLVAYARWGGEPVIAKLFFSQKEAKQACFRDARGVKILMQANVPTPKLLYEGTALNQEKLYVLLLEKIDNAITLADCWRNRSSLEMVLPLMRMIAAELALHHTLGILQHDLHFKNFLVTAACIYSLDGSKIKKYDHPIPKKLSIEYFALLLMQLGVSGESLHQELFQTYAHARGWKQPSQADQRRLRADLCYLRKDYGRRFLRKIFRDCTLFKKISTKDRSIMYDREYQSEAFIDFLYHPEKIFSHPSTKTLKAGRTCTVVKIQIDRKILVVKRYNIKSFWHRVRRLFRKTRAARSWRLAQQLQLSGMVTAKPVAFIDTHFLGMRGKSYFIMEYVAAEHVGDYFLNNTATEAEQKKMAGAVIHVLKDLKTLRIIHGDLKMTNILIHQDKPMLIDLDGMTEYRSRWRLAQAFKKEIKRFMQNWVNHPNIHALLHDLLKEGKLL